MPILLEPQTPLPVPQVPIPALEDESFWALGFELADPVRSVFCSLVPNPYPSDDGRGDVVRLLSDWLGACCAFGRLPIGPMPPLTGAVVDLDICREWEVSSPIGGVGALPEDGVGPSKVPNPDEDCVDGEAAFSAREPSGPDAAPCPLLSPCEAWLPMPKGSAPRGDDPRAPPGPLPGTPAGSLPLVSSPVKGT